MKATKLLKTHHRKVETLFKDIEKTDDAAEKSRLFEELAADLVAHDTIEREIFYPAYEQAAGMTKRLGESLVEHGIVEFCLYQADQAQGNGDFEFKLTALKEVVQHHVDEEEEELFPKVEKALGEELLARIGMQMELRFENAKQADYRETLSKNLRQVVAGELEVGSDEAVKQPASRERRSSQGSGNVARAGRKQVTIDENHSRSFRH